MSQTESKNMEVIEADYELKELEELDYVKLARKSGKFNDHEIEMFKLLNSVGFNKNWIYLSEEIVENYLGYKKSKDMMTTFYKIFAKLKSLVKDVNYKIVKADHPIILAYNKQLALDSKKIKKSPENKLYYIVTGKAFKDLVMHVDTNKGAKARVYYIKIKEFAIDVSTEFLKNLVKQEKERNKLMENRLENEKTYTEELKLELYKNKEVAEKNAQLAKSIIVLETQFVEIMKDYVADFKQKILPKEEIEYVFLAKPKNKPKANCRISATKTHPDQQVNIMNSTKDEDDELEVVYFVKTSDCIMLRNRIHKVLKNRKIASKCDIFKGSVKYLKSIINDEAENFRNIINKALEPDRKFIQGIENGKILEIIYEYNNEDIELPIVNTIRQIGMDKQNTKKTRRESI